MRKNAVLDLVPPTLLNSGIFHYSTLPHLRSDGLPFLTFMCYNAIRNILLRLSPQFRIQKGVPNFSNSIYVENAEYIPRWNSLPASLRDDQHSLSLHFAVYSRLNFSPEHTTLLQHVRDYIYPRDVVSAVKRRRGCRLPGCLAVCHSRYCV